MVGAVVVVYSESGPLPAELISAGFWLPAVVFGAAGAGVLDGARPPAARPAAGRRPPCERRGSGLVMLCGGGAVLAAVSLAWHAG
ncbi:hypothetical protein SNARM312S_05254 [Streptomyces narbonensis]